MGRTRTQQERTEPEPRFCQEIEQNVNPEVKDVQEPELNRTLHYTVKNRIQMSWFLLGSFTE